MLINLETEKEIAAKEAVKLIENNMIVGLGTGSSSAYAIKEISRLVKNGMNIKGVPTSKLSEEMALALEIPLIDINEIENIDLTIDGVDEFTNELFLIKGGGGALFKEKIIASLSDKEIIIADSSKKVEKLGKFKVPIEVLPFAKNLVTRELIKLNGTPYLREKNNNSPEGTPVGIYPRAEPWPQTEFGNPQSETQGISKNNKVFLTDSGNIILDTDFGIIDDPVSLSSQLNEIVGIVCHGIFVNLATKIIIGSGNTTITIEK